MVERRLRFDIRAGSNAGAIIAGVVVAALAIFAAIVITTGWNPLKGLP